MTITINDDCSISTTLFEKKSNLHLYIPSSSAHPPGLLPGIVFGNILRIHNLCSHQADIAAKTAIFYQRLLARGYQPQLVKPLLKAAIARATQQPGPIKAKKQQHQYAILHLPYHPQNPPSWQIQRAWRDTISLPHHHPESPLSQLRIPYSGNIKEGRFRMGFDRLIIAYSRAPNLGNLLSYRRLPSTNGPPASSFIEPLESARASNPNPNSEPQPYPATSPAVHPLAH